MHCCIKENRVTHTQGKSWFQKWRLRSKADPIKVVAWLMAEPRYLQDVCLPRPPMTLRVWRSRCTCSRTHTRTHTHPHKHTHMHSHMLTYTHMHTLTYTYIYTRTHTHTYTYIHTHSHTHTHTCTHMHSHTHAQTWAVLSPAHFLSLSSSTVLVVNPFLADILPPLNFLLFPLYLLIHYMLYRTIL